MISLRSLWSPCINQIEQFLKYTFPNEMKDFLSTKLIKVATHTVNEALDEETIVLCYCNPENTCYKYNQRITIRLKGESKLFPVWEYKGNSYIKFNSLEDIIND